MKTIQRTFYVTDDGREFDSAHEAENHELELRIAVFFERRGLQPNYAPKEAASCVRIGWHELKTIMEPAA